jgi:hypothetical protein
MSTKFLKMRSIHLLFTAVIVAALCGAGCKKKTTAVATNYLPLKVGNKWTYRNTPPGTNNTLTVTDKDTTINGRMYMVLSNTAGPSNYWAKVGNDYYRYALTSQIPGQSGLEELYLKGEVALNTTWNASQPVNITGFGMVNIKQNYKITELGITKTVQGKVYNDCAHVRLDLVASVPLLGDQSIGGGDFYYANGVGLITYTLSVTVPGQAAINQQSDLISYEFK